VIPLRDGLLLSMDLNSVACDRRGRRPSYVRVRFLGIMRRHPLDFEGAFGGFDVNGDRGARKRTGRRRTKRRDAEE
jgi:hypothetical protein